MYIPELKKDSNLQIGEVKNMKNEIWKDIPDYEGLYQVSNFGRVKSENRIVRNRNGRFVKPGRILKIADNGKGYKFVYLKNSEKKKWYVHRLVATTFIPNNKESQYVNHIDCNPSNNSVDNLEWCTPQENTQYMFKMNRQNRTDAWRKKHISLWK